MECALRSGGAGRWPGTELAGWLCVSLFSHLLLVYAGLGIARPESPHQPATLTVEIKAVAEEFSKPITELQRKSELPPSHTKAAHDEIGSRPASAAPVPLENYFHMSEVDLRAEPINEVLLRYPWPEYRRGLSGTVRFRLFINAEGKLDKVELVNAEPPGHFEEAALEAITKLRFNAARKNGRPVKSQKTIDVVFDPNDHIEMRATRRGSSAAGT